MSIIPAIGGVGAGWTASASTTPVSGATTAGTSAPAAAGAAAGSGADFGKVLGQGLQDVQDAQTKADNLAVQAATGDLTDVHDYMIASTQATLMTELTVAVRNKAVEAFNDIMRMPL